VCVRVCVCARVVRRVCIYIQNYRKRWGEIWKITPYPVMSRSAAPRSTKCSPLLGLAPFQRLSARTMTNLWHNQFMAHMVFSWHSIKTIHTNYSIESRHEPWLVRGVTSVWLICHMNKSCHSIKTIHTNYSTETRHEPWTVFTEWRDLFIVNVCIVWLVFATKERKKESDMTDSNVNDCLAWHDSFTCAWFA